MRTAISSASCSVLRFRRLASGSTSNVSEFIEVRAFPFDEVVRMVERSEIVDAMTALAVLHAARRR